MKFQIDLKFLNSFSGATPTIFRKEIVNDFRKKDTEIMPLKINDKMIEQVSIYGTNVLELPLMKRYTGATT